MDKCNLTYGALVLTITGEELIIADVKAKSVSGIMYDYSGEYISGDKKGRRKPLNSADIREVILAGI